MSIATIEAKANAHGESGHTQDGENDVADRLHRIPSVARRVMVQRHDHDVYDHNALKKKQK